jgi:hypothetical protein
MPNIVILFFVFYRCVLPPSLFNGHLELVHFKDLVGAQSAIEEAKLCLSKNVMFFFFEKKQSVLRFIDNRRRVARFIGKPGLKTIQHLVKLRQPDTPKHDITMNGHNNNTTTRPSTSQQHNMQ